MFDDEKYFSIKIVPYGTQVSLVNRMAAYIGDRLHDQLKIFEKIYRPSVSFDIYQVDYSPVTVAGGGGSR